MFPMRIASLLAFAGAADAASSLGEVKHVVMMMLENRSFQHVISALRIRNLVKSIANPVNQYYGTMAGVRGFADPNVQVNPDGRSVWYQLVTTSKETQ